MRNINFQKRGKGKIVVLLHGFCESLEIWNHIIDPLAEEYQVIAIDLPGFGDSPLPEDSFSIASIATDIFYFMDELTEDKITCIGHSLGGYVALALAEKYPEKISALGLINSTAYADDDDKKQKRLKTIDFIEKHGKEKFLESFVPGLFYDSSSSEIKEQVEFTKEIANKTSVEAMLAYTLAMRERTSRVHVIKNEFLPVLFLAGKKDAIVSHDDSEEQMKLIHKGHALFIDKSGHMSMLENQQQTLESIKGFLKSFY